MQCDNDINRRREIGRGRHVVNAQQVKTGEQASDHGARGVAGVQISPRGNATRPSDDRRQRSTHQDRRREHAERREDSAPQHSGHAVLGSGDVQAIQRRQAELHQDRARGDSQFEGGVNFQRMLRQADAREPQAADAQASHEGREQDAERNRGRPDGELQQLVPDDFVDQRAHAARRKKNQKDG